MTNSEAIDVIRDYLVNKVDNEPMQKACQLALEALQRPTVPQWIPCSKQMPPVGKTVLVTVKTDTETWTDCDTWFQGDWMAYMGNSREIVAWCDLPEPYEEEINEHS